MKQRTGGASAIQAEKPASSATRRPVRQRSVLKPTDRGRQVTRLLDLLRSLERARYGLTVAEILEQGILTCSQRTVYRDLRDLMSAGFPIEQDDSRFSLKGPTLSTEPLQSSQLLALLLAEDLLTPLQGSPLQLELSALGDSLRARLTPVGRTWLESVRANLTVTQRAPSLALSNAGLEELQEALVGEQVLRIEYAAPDKPIQARDVEPHLLWCRGDSPYLVAYCRRAEAFRIFALQRIKSAVRLEDTFERREDFNPDEYVRRGFGAYHGETHRVLVRFSSEVSHLAHERTWHASQQITRHAHGADLEMTVEGIPEVAAWIAGFGGKVQALEPPLLRSRVRELHQAGLDAHHGEPKVDATEPSRAARTPAKKRRAGKSSARPARLTPDDTAGA